MLEIVGQYRVVVVHLGFGVMVGIDNLIELLCLFLEPLHNLPAYKFGDSIQVNPLCGFYIENRTAVEVMAAYLLVVCIDLVEDQPCAYVLVVPFLYWLRNMP